MYSFGKEERLCSKKLIDSLFQSGQRFIVFPYSVHWMTCPPDSLPSGIPAQALIATSKKKFRHAVDRNRIKRLTRECYRTHKPQIYQFLNSHNVTIVLSLNYVHNEIFDHSTLNHKFDRITDTLIQHISTHLDSHPSQQS